MPSRLSGETRAGREPAQADRLRGDALLDRAQAARIAEQRDVRVGVQVDEPGRDGEPGEVDLLARRRRRRPARRPTRSGRRAIAEVAVDRRARRSRRTAARCAGRRRSQEGVRAGRDVAIPAAPWRRRQHQRDPVAVAPATIQQSARSRRGRRPGSGPAPLVAPSSAATPIEASTASARSAGSSDGDRADRAVGLDVGVADRSIATHHGERVEPGDRSPERVVLGAGRRRGRARSMAARSSGVGRARVARIAGVARPRRRPTPRPAASRGNIPNRP